MKSTVLRLGTYWNLTTELGLYDEAYGCLADGCYNFYLYDYWQPGYGSVDPQR